MQPGRRQGLAGPFQVAALVAFAPFQGVQLRLQLGLSGGDSLILYVDFPRLSDRVTKFGEAAADRRENELVSAGDHRDQYRQGQKAAQDWRRRRHQSPASRSSTEIWKRSRPSRAS